MKIVNLSMEPIDTRRLHDRLEDPACGGVAIFEGRVRNHHQGRAVRQLFYECYPAMAKKVLMEIALETQERWQVRRLAAVHRYGEIPIGEVAVWVGVSSAHREEAFAACRYLIEEIKKRVPIWKKETYLDGSEQWVSCHTPALALS